MVALSSNTKTISREGNKVTKSTTLAHKEGICTSDNYNDDLRRRAVSAAAKVRTQVEPRGQEHLMKDKSNQGAFRKGLHGDAIDNRGVQKHYRSSMHFSVSSPLKSAG